MPIASTTALVDALRQLRLLEAAQLEEAKAIEARFLAPKTLAGELIRRGWLTSYQANQLLQGRGQDLLLGSYILLERLGEGGMGAVFKARNWKLGKVVALKLIRKERLESEDAVRRFHREIRAAAALKHPNIVHAIDADQIGGTHLLVMECIEGATDLAKRVKQNGPLPVAPACDYIRQAALGLQHAFEKGMVHRDIKPANLLLTADGKIVKILDMGLARLDHAEADGENSSTMTQEGAVMGTPDYIAPEQAMESHTVDIRADLYSLGCTFYYLLSGKVPFPGGSMMEKLLKHRLEEPRPIEQLRSDLPTGVARVVRKLMAKKPEGRYQTPMEAATALAHACSSGSGGANEEDGTLAEGRRTASAGELSEDTFASPFASLERTPTVAANALGPHPTANDVRWLLYIVGCSSFLLIGAVVLISFFWKDLVGTTPPAAQEEPRAVVLPPREATGDAARIEKIAPLSAEEQVKAVVAWLKELNPGFDGKETHRIDGGVVTELRFATDKVTDVSPVRALKGLQTLDCSGTHTAHRSNGQLANLSPLAGMKLTKLTCNDTPVSELWPLKDMKLTELSCSQTKVSDLTPLTDMKLTKLYCHDAPITDLSPLTGMPLTLLQCNFTNVADLTPLKDMKLTFLYCCRTRVADLSPLKGMPLKHLWCDLKHEHDAEILRSIKTLEKINDKPVKEFWAEVDGKKR